MILLRPHRLHTAYPLGREEIVLLAMGRESVVGAGQDSMGAGRYWAERVGMLLYFSAAQHGKDCPTLRGPQPMRGLAKGN